jgi:chemotaxis protein methyltransferase CheR
MVPITDAEFVEFTRLVNQLTGIVLDDTKRYLIETRIGPLVDELKLSNYRSLLDLVKSGGKPALQERIIDAITTNETFFFREPGAFDLLRRRLIPKALDERTGSRSREPMRIWSAACSSGQEMYSLAISALELIGTIATERIAIDGSDISEQILARASLGAYSQFEVNRGMPANLLSKYFTATPTGFRVVDHIRAMCSFNKANLLRLGPMMHRYDVILCRNVSIYFSPAERIVLFRSLANCLIPGGALIVGSTEQVRDCESILRMVNDFPGCYYYQRI